MTNNKDSKDGGLQTKQPILPLTGTTAPPLDKHNSRVVNLSTQPGVNGASEYKMSIRALNGDEDLGFKLVWARDAQTVMTGLNCSDIAPRIALAQTLIITTGHAGFLTALDDLAQIRFDNVKGTTSAGCHSEFRSGEVGIPRTIHLFYFQPKLT